MLSIAKPIKIKVLLRQFSLLMFNLRYIFLFTVFLLDCGIAGIREMPYYQITPGGPKGAERENKTKTKQNKQDAVGPFFPACFLPCKSRSRGRYWRLLACLHSLVLRAYCNFESKRAISITLFGRGPNRLWIVAIHWGCILGLVESVKSKFGVIGIFQNVAFHTQKR